MDHKTSQLLRSAAQLYSLGFDIEAAKERICRLVRSGVDYGTPEMAQAVSKYNEIKAQWDKLEAEYLKQRGEILNKREVI